MPQACAVPLYAAIGGPRIGELLLEARDFGPQGELRDLLFFLRERDGYRPRYPGEMSL